jgi:predicted DCC family thiol-disulfide oxidoreductase YuxK
MAQDSRKSELIAELARSRDALSTAVRGVGRSLDLTHRVADAFARNRFAWITGASLLGFALAKLPARTRKVVIDRKGRPAQAGDTAVKAGLLITVLKLVFDLVRPALAKWLTQRVTSYAQERFNSSIRR